MDTNQPQTQILYGPAPSRGVFGTNIPSSVAFGVAVLLFFLPFVEIKCNNMALQSVSGFQLATGFEMKNNKSNNSIFNDITTEDTKTTTRTDKKDANFYALIALGLGVLGLALSFTNARAGLGMALVSGVISAGCLIGLMIDIKRKANLDINKGTTGSGENLGKLNEQLDQIKISVDFTPWYYISIIAFLAAAFFCYKRIQLKNINKIV